MIIHQVYAFFKREDLGPDGIPKVDRPSVCHTTDQREAAMYHRAHPEMCRAQIKMEFADGTQITGLSTIPKANQ